MPGKNAAVRMLCADILRLSMPCTFGPVVTPTIPMSTNSVSKAVSNDPRFAGTRSQGRQKLRPQCLPRHCTPVPTTTAKDALNFGGRNTSPCTSFQPLSSRSSAFLPRWGSCYSARDPCKVRTIIIATIVVRKTPISTELIIENQCTPSLLALSIERYMSHRVATGRWNATRLRSYK